MLGLLAEGLSIAAAAKEAGISAKRVKEISHGERTTRDRRDSVAYYARHPERIPGQWYPVEDGDPELPDYSSFSTKTRPITERADAR